MNPYDIHIIPADVDSIKKEVAAWRKPVFDSMDDLIASLEGDD